MPSFRALKTAAAELRGLAELGGRDTQVLPRIFRLRVRVRFCPIFGLSDLIEKKIWYQIVCLFSN